MLDKKTLQLLEKIAQDDATGASQYKQRTVKSKKNYTGPGTALGALIGAGAGALSPKLKPVTTVLGSLAGALGGREIGKRTEDRQKTWTQEGVIKKQQKTKAPGATATVPKIDDKAVLKLLKSDE